MIIIRKKKSDMLMVKEYSPFTPGLPVPIEFFVGREAEIRRFISGVKRSLELRTIERFFIMGERGIGKSSICKYALSLAEKDYQVLGLHVFLGGVDSLEEMARRIFERLLSESVDKPWYSKIRDFLGNHIRQLDIFGLSVEFSATSQELSRAVSDFIPALRNLLKQLAPEKRGIVLVLDDINGLAASERFANWLKSLVDEVAASSKPLPLTLALSGLAERRRQLIAAQPSLDRVFDIVDIQRFSESETRDFFQRAFRKVNVEIDPAAINDLWKYSGGYPVFMHELGDAVFKADTDNRISQEDAMQGIIQGAQVIGVKYIEPKVLGAIRSEPYKDILEKIPQGWFGPSFRRKKILEKLSEPEAKVFDNFLRKMESLGVIRKDKEHGPGAYEFTSDLYHLFFALQSPAPAS